MTFQDSVKYSLANVLSSNSLDARSAMSASLQYSSNLSGDFPSVIGMLPAIVETELITCHIPFSLSFPFLFLNPLRKVLQAMLNLGGIEQPARVYLSFIADMY
jgi:hypothetical protein